MTVSTSYPLEFWNAGGFTLKANPNDQGWSVFHAHPSPYDVQTMPLSTALTVFQQVMDCRNYMDNQISNVVYISGTFNTTEVVGASEHNGKYRFIPTPEAQALQIASQHDSQILDMLSRRIALLQGQISTLQAQRPIVPARLESRPASTDESTSFWSFSGCCHKFDQFLYSACYSKYTSYSSC